MWSHEGDRVYFLSSGPGLSSVYSCDLEGNARQEVGGQRRIYDFDVASGVTALCASDISNPGDLHMFMQGAEARVTDLNPWLRERYVAQPERHAFTAPDGWRLEGWLFRPPDFDPSRKYPLVMEVHGGPHGQYGWAFFHELQILAGSDGYGEHFRRQVVRDWGGKDYIDLMSALDQAIEQTGTVDVSRLGIGGGSYGGYMTNWVIGQTNRFSAAVAMRSISNLVSEYSQHDIVLWGALELGPPPWPDLDELWKRSPIRYVQNIQTPLLLSCGEMDLRCAISQSEELFGAMRFLGKTVEMVRFPEESHDLSRSGRPDRRVERLKRIAGWYERFLGTASTEAEVEAETQVLPVQREEVVGAVEAFTPTAVMETVHMPEVVESSPTAVLETVHVEDLPAAVEPEPDVAEAEPAVADTVVEAPEAEVEAPVTGDPYTTAALPVFPEPEPSIDAVPAAEEPQLETAEPEPVAEEVEPVAEPLEPVELEAWSEPEPEPEPVAAEAAPEPEPEPEPLEAVPVEPEPVEAIAPEPMASEPEPVAAEAEAEPVMAEAEPVMAEAEPVMAEAEPEPVPEPVIEEPEPEPEPEPVAAQTPPPAPGKSVTSTMLRWPTNPGMQDNGSSDSDAGEAATSVIPAWQPTEMPSESRRTVSLSAMPPEAIAAGEAFAAKLSFETGPFTGRIIALPNQMVTLGRAPDNDVVVADPATSGRHGRIEVRAGAFWISDLGSTNGTLVNGEPVIDKQLSDGDLIAIGQNTIRFSLE
ncbi:MAG: FHA domain-containing protein [Chloroflexi bacterium]|nr:MAG: FHA domain-containing protein [Chloroflexota bacterium]